MLLKKCFPRREDSNSRIFLVLPPAGEAFGEGRVENERKKSGKADKPADEAAAAILGPQFKELDKLDEYAADWKNFLIIESPDNHLLHGKFNEGQEVITRGRVNFRNEKTGQVEHSLNGEVKVSTGPYRIQVKDKIFINVVDGKGNSGFMAEEYLLPPPKNPGGPLKHRDMPVPNDLNMPRSQLQKVPQQKEGEPRKNIGLEEYCAGNEQLKAFCANYKAEFTESVMNFSSAAAGTRLAQFAARLAEDLPQSIDGMLLILFKTLGVKENPALLSKITVKRAPQIVFNAQLLKGVEAEHHEGRIEMNPNGDFQNNYDVFKHVLTHELFHDLCENGGEHEENPVITEGGIELLAQEVSGASYSSQYAERVQLARHLLQLNRQAFITWLSAGGSNASFQEAITKNLTERTKNPEGAKKMANEIVTLSDTQKIEAERIASMFEGVFRIDQTSKKQLASVAYQRIADVPGAEEKWNTTLKRVLRFDDKPSPIQITAIDEAEKRFIAASSEEKVNRQLKKLLG